MVDIFEVRDCRDKAMFRVDDEYLNGYSKLCGVNSTLVYLCLCRHADRRQESFPSVALMAEKLGVSRDSVIRGIKKLIDWNIISKERERRKDAKWLNNRYILLDKSVWKPKPSSLQQHGSQVANSVEPSRSQNESQVAVSDTKDTHKKDTHIRIAEQSSALFIFKDYLKELEDHKARHVNVIGHFFEEKGITYDSREKSNAAVKRHLRAAKEVAKFSDHEIVKATEEAKKQYPDIWVVETILKILTR